MDAIRVCDGQQHGHLPTGPLKYWLMVEAILELEWWRREETTDGCEEQVGTDLVFAWRTIYSPNPGKWGEKPHWKLSRNLLLLPIVVPSPPQARSLKRSPVTQVKLSMLVPNVDGMGGARIIRLNNVNTTYYNIFQRIRDLVRHNDQYMQIIFYFRIIFKLRLEAEFYTARIQTPHIRVNNPRPSRGIHFCTFIPTILV